VHAICGMYRTYQTQVAEWIWPYVGLEKGKGNGKGKGKGEGTRAEFDEWHRERARVMRARPHVQSSDSD
jgi:hypothetical protein